MDTDFRKECENSNIKFSIIVPVYNVEKFLRESLDSIVAQTFKDFEVICVNDGSTDNSLDILEEYAKNDSRFKIISQENQGQGIARNKAIDIAQGRYLLFVDPDDWIETNALEQIWNKAETTDANIVQFNYEIYNDLTKKRKQRIIHKLAQKKDAYNLKKKGFFNWHIFKKGMFRDFCLAIWNRAYRTDFIKMNDILYKNEDELVKQVIDALEIMLDKKECLL